MSSISLSRPLTRDQLAAFLPSHQAVKAFEKMQDANTIFANTINVILAEIDALQNPVIAIVTANYSMSDDAYGVVVDQAGIVVTLPQALETRIGREWTVTMAVAGSFTLSCFAGDTFPTPSNLTETSALFNRSGMTMCFRCVAINRWVVV